ncbi:MAG: chromosome partitioning protein [Myxococcota bacterium]|jgi:chromosome partitioning protein
MSVMNTISGFRRMVRGGPEVDRGNRNARVIAVAARKGGVGKTTTSVNLAAELAKRHGRKVLLIDMDAQGHVEMSLRSEVPAGGSLESMSQILLGKRRDMHEIVRPTSVPGLWVIPSDRELNDTESLMSTRIGKELLLRHALTYARSHFDVILIDCPPNLGTLTVNALVAADQVLIPCDLSTLSLDGVDSLIDTLETIQETLNPTIGVLGLLRTRVDRRNQKMNLAIEDTLKERYGNWLLETDIGVSTDIAKAQHDGRPVLNFKSQSRGAIAYQQLGEEIDRRIFGA